MVYYNEAELQLDAQACRTYIHDKDYENALAIIGKYFPNFGPFQKALIDGLSIHDFINFYVGLKLQGKCNEAYAFTYLLGASEIDLKLNKPGAWIEMLNNFYYRDLTSGE